MKSAAIRQRFLQYFQSKGHTIVPSSSLVPGNDPTLLFTNAGMNQFKEVFLGNEKRPYTRAVSSQRCVRAGGKHNDLENVGYTARHHTFFEMLGNFSFGDYFKREAILFAWEFLTSSQWLGIPADKLLVTVYEEDHDAFNIWHQEVGLAKERIIRIGDKDGRYQSDNFWAMGETGPCGPCTEIFYDHGESIWGGPPGTPEEEGDRFIEIWNVVFMQYNRSSNGTLTPLPLPSVDTGMGLERVAAVLQGVHSNYEIDIFQALIAAAAEATASTDLENKSLRVIADHSRSCSFLISDGVVPSNEGRGYVLRRIIRRAIRHGHKLGQKQVFFHTLVAALVEQMGDAYPELRERQAQIENAVLKEEQQFEKTLDKGMSVLEQALQTLSGQEIPGQLIFKLYDTYGFPMDLTNDIARERGLSLDESGYQRLMEEQRARARASGSFKMDYTARIKLEGETDFLGYEGLSGSGQVLAIYTDKGETERLSQGERAMVVLDRSPFYAESGGQVGDTGYIDAPEGRFEVRACIPQMGHHLHLGQVLEGCIVRRDKVESRVDQGIRQATALNHSATHLLHAALRKILGEHVTQKGSLVGSQRLRFDFSHFEGLSWDQLREIEALVNEQIRKNTLVQTEVCDMETAKAKGAMALFGEKYGDQVRVLTMGLEVDAQPFSVELCGGTHVSRTGDIGLMRITSESGIAAGVRRIEALTGKAALELFDQIDRQSVQAARLLKAKPDSLVKKIDALMAHNRQLEKELANLKSKLSSATSGDLISQAVDVDGIKVLAASVEGGDAKSLRDTADQLKNKLGSGVVVVATVGPGNKISLVSGVTKDLTSTIKAGELMSHVCSQLDGKGGGRPDMAQGGATKVQDLPQTLASVADWVRSRLSS